MPPTTDPTGDSIPPRTAAAKAKRSTACIMLGSRKTTGATSMPETVPTAAARPQPRASMVLVRTPSSREYSG